MKSFIRILEGQLFFRIKQISEIPLYLSCPLTNISSSCLGAICRFGLIQLLNIDYLQSYSSQKNKNGYFYRQLFFFSCCSLYIFFFKFFFYNIIYTTLSKRYNCIQIGRQSKMIYLKIQTAQKRNLHAAICAIIEKLISTGRKQLKTNVLLMLFRLYNHATLVD